MSQSHERSNLVISLYLRRLELGETIKSVSDFIGVKWHTLRDWEQGYSTPAVPYVARWAEVLGLKLELMDSSGRVFKEV